MKNLLETVIADYGITKEQFEELAELEGWTEEQKRDIDFVDNELDERYSFTGWPWDNE